MVRAWICDLKEKAESKVIFKQWTCDTGESVKPLTVIDHSGGGA